MAQPVTQTIQGSRMLLNPDDGGLSADLARDSIREPVTTMAYRAGLYDLAGRTDGTVTVLDAGANIGYYALQPVALLNDVEVLAIEPDPDSADWLRRNVELNDYGDRITVVERGVGAESGTATLHRLEKANWNTMNARKAAIQRGLHVEDVEVPIEPLDDIVREHGLDPDDVDVLRMDVEGYEHRALAGAEAVLAEPERLLVNIELHGVLLDNDELAQLSEAMTSRPSRIRSAARNDAAIEASSIADLLAANWVEAVLEWGRTGW